MDHAPAFLKLVMDAKPHVREIDVEEARKRVDAGARLIDVREDYEWQQGHAQGAEHLSRGTIERDIEKKIPEKDAELVLYCGGGFRSALAAESIQKMGYTNAYSMDGGWKAWVESGAAVEGSRSTAH